MSRELEDLRHLLKQKAILKARDSFLAYIRMMGPHIIPENFVEGKHIQMIVDKLEKVESGEIKRLQIWMPPRSMKSRLASILFPSWVIGKHPTWDCMSISYSRDLATDFSREVRTLVQHEEYKEIFPFTQLRPDAKAAFRWWLTGGGVYTAGGIQSGIAGKGAHVAVIDDPLSEQDALSASARKKVHGWYPAGLRSRLAPGGRIVLVTTRWHEADLAGFLLKQQESDPRADKWDVLEVPALIETDEQKKIFGYDFNTSYWPERWDTEDLLVTKGNMPSHQWQALYQQHPTAPEGGVFKEKWFQEWPKKSPPKCEYILQSYDTAFSKKESADYSAISTWGIFYLMEEVETPGGKRDEIKTPQLILLNSVRGRYEFHELCEIAKSLFDDYKPDAMVIEKKASGQSLIQELTRIGLPVQSYMPDKDKISRAYACQPVFEAGRVWFKNSKTFTQELKEEALAFPYGAHDDLVDSMCQAIQWVRDRYRLTYESDSMHFWKEENPKHRKTYWSALNEVAPGRN